MGSDSLATLPPPTVSVPPDTLTAWANETQAEPFTAAPMYHRKQMMQGIAVVVIVLVMFWLTTWAWSRERK